MEGLDSDSAGRPIAAAGADELVVDHAEGRFQGTEYQSLLTLGAVTHAPKWDREKSDAPISLDKARELAVSSIQNQLGYYRTPTGSVFSEFWEVRDANLTRFFRFEDRWYYKVELRPRFRGPDQIFPARVSVFVTMDGVVSPLAAASRTNAFLGSTNNLNGTCKLTFQGTQLAQYDLLCNREAAAPLEDWKVLRESRTKVTDTNGVWSATVTNSTQQLYFRAVPVGLWRPRGLRL